MDRIRHTLGPLIAFHGCDRSIGEAVLAGTQPLQPSNNDYDWLGPGVYFWVDSFERGLHWATELTARPEPEVERPFVVGALIHPSLCLNLTDAAAMRELLDAYACFAKMSAAGGWELPRNSARANDVFLCRIPAPDSGRKRTYRLPFATLSALWGASGPRDSSKRAGSTAAGVRDAANLRGHGVEQR